jgi:hypothetical protein
METIPAGTHIFTVQPGVPHVIAFQSLASGTVTAGWKSDLESIVVNTYQTASGPATSTVAGADESAVWLVTPPTPYIAIVTDADMLIAVQNAVIGDEIFRANTPNEIANIIGEAARSWREWSGQWTLSGVSLVSDGGVQVEVDTGKFSLVKVANNDNSLKFPSSPAPDNLESLVVSEMHYIAGYPTFTSASQIVGIYLNFLGSYQNPLEQFTTFLMGFYTTQSANPTSNGGNIGIGEEIGFTYNDSELALYAEAITDLAGINWLVSVNGLTVSPFVIANWNVAATDGGDSIVTRGLYDGGLYVPSSEGTEWIQALPDGSYTLLDPALHTYPNVQLEGQDPVEYPGFLDPTLRTIFRGVAYWKP